MIYFCDICNFIKDRNAFDEYYEYEKNECLDCRDKDPREIPDDFDLDQLDPDFLEDAPGMQFGETEEDYEERLRQSLELVTEDDGDFIPDGEDEEEEL